MGRIITRADGARFHVGGRKRPGAEHARTRLHLSRYLDRSKLPAVPATGDYTPAASSALANVYLNDQLGDCVIAGGCHVRGVTSANGDGTPVVFSDGDVTAMYGKIGGYVPGDPSTDNGCDEATALAYWTSTGFTDGVKLSGSIAVLPGDAKLALYLFENVFYGMELPDAWVNPFPSSPGFTWDVAGDPDPSNGHCVVGLGWDESRIKICTWGMLGWVTDAATSKYTDPGAGGQLFTLLSPDIIACATQKAPNGLDMASLVADLQALSQASS